VLVVVEALNDSTEVDEGEDLKVKG